jgi:hypothetical protein
VLLRGIAPGCRARLRIGDEVALGRDDDRARGIRGDGDIEDHAIRSPVKPHGHRDLLSKEEVRNYIDKITLSALTVQGGAITR